jgi:hypothetical protein
MSQTTIIIIKPQINFLQSLIYNTFNIKVEIKTQQTRKTRLLNM